VSEPAPSSASPGWRGYTGLGYSAGPKAIEESDEHSIHTAHKETSSAPSIASPQPHGDLFPVKRQVKVSGISPPGGSWFTPWGWSGSSGPTLDEKIEAERIGDAVLARPDPSPLSSRPPSIDVDEQCNGTKLASSGPTTGL